MGGLNGQTSTRHDSDYTERERLLAGDGVRVLEPHLVLPSQFFPVHKRSDAAEGARRLYAAVLEDAVACFQKHGSGASRRSCQLYSDAEAWLFSDDTSWPFAFVNVCEALDIQPPFLRHRLRCWKQRCQGASPQTAGHTC